MNSLEVLFDAWEENVKDSKETESALEILCEDDDLKKYWESFYLIVDAICGERKAAFFAGFEAAKQLFVGGIRRTTYR